MTNKTRKAIFLDRDGTLIRDKNYLARVEDIEYFPDTFEALALLVSKGYGLYVITNQSGVGRGYFGIDAVHAVHKAMDADMQGQGLMPFEAWGICPHAPDEQCLCRKPEPKLILDFIQRDGLDATQCWMLGDKEIDAECGRRAGINGAMVRVRPKGNYQSFATLLEFAQKVDSLLLDQAIAEDG
jgi:histidinol-phosphate phosphatase family protein